MFDTIANTAVTTLGSAVSGAGPAVIGVVGLLAGVGIVVALLRKASK
jgi:hypothetical protein